MSTQVQTQEIAKRLRGCAAGLERDAGSLTPADQSSPSLTDLSRRADTLKAWGARAGQVLDEAFDSGVLQWEHYERLKADEARWRRTTAEWYYRLFLATTSHIAASEARTEGIELRGFLCTRCPEWNFCDEWQHGDSARAYCAAIRQVADLVENEQ